MHASRFIFILISFIVIIVMAGGCAYVKKDVVQIPCTIPANISYVRDIAPILETNCADCHSANSNTSGILLDNYEALKFYARNGFLYGTISHSAGFRPMPDGGFKLNDCTIATIKKWIDNGTPQ